MRVASSNVERERRDDERGGGDQQESDGSAPQHGRDGRPAAAPACRRAARALLSAPAGSRS